MSEKLVIIKGSGGRFRVPKDNLNLIKLAQQVAGGPPPSTGPISSSEIVPDYGVYISQEVAASRQAVRQSAKPIPGNTKSVDINGQLFEVIYGNDGKIVSMKCFAGIVPNR